MARKYRKIDPRIWGDEKFAKLPDADKLVALYCLTTPQGNRIGLFRFSIGAAAEDLGTLPQTFEERFHKVCKTLNWVFDPGSKVLFLPTWWKYNGPENPNIFQSCLDDVHDIPATPLLDAFYGNDCYLSQRLRQRFDKVKATLGVTIPKPPAQEQEQEQEQEQDYLRARKKRFTKPTVEEVKAYCLERKNCVEPQAFIDHYTANGWKVGRNPMKDWRAAVRTWEKNHKPEKSRVPTMDELSDWNPTDGGSALRGAT